MRGSIGEIVVYPLKSGAGQSLPAAEVGTRGLAGDRSWMLVDANGRFVSGREWPALVRVQVQADGAWARFALDGSAALEVAVPADAPRLEVEVWGSRMSAADAGDTAAAWFSAAFGQSLRLVHADAAMQRPLDPKYARPEDETAFADGFPLLLLSRAACEELSARAGRDLGWRRFRPNLVIDGVPAHAEDGWTRVRIGTVEFDVVKPCVRCVFTTVDPDRGVREADGEPLRALKDYRRGAKGITFGQNLLARGSGAIRQGDPLVVL